MQDKGWKNVVIGIQTAMILSMFTFFFGFAGQYVTKDDLEILAPYTRDKDVISNFMKDSAKTMAKLSQAVDKMDEKYTREIHKLDKEISMLNRRAGT